MDQVVDLIHRSNQRGGRMLSVVDLIDAGTLNLPQAGWLAARILNGASFLVGARPGGAGKTTVMGALMGLIPDWSAAYLATPGSDWRKSRPGDCIVAYEISPGSYEAYIWGETLCVFCRFGRKGRRIVSNLHADTLEEAIDQIENQNGVAPGDFLAFGIFLPIRVAGNFGRRVDVIYYVEDGQWTEAGLQSGPQEQFCQEFFQRCLRDGVRTIEDVRKNWLQMVNRRKRGDSTFSF